jgi:oligopeptide/dipeptide ABC transporter ATP-binding protein
VINLLRDLQERRNLSFIFISHDLSTVRYISHTIAVMYLGKIVEQGPTDELFARPLHPYTDALLSAVPVPDPAIESRREVHLLTGDPPSPVNPPAGCRFSTRCPFVADRCRQEEPSLRDYGGGHLAACHFAGVLPISPLNYPFAHRRCKTPFGTRPRSIRAMRRFRAPLMARRGWPENHSLAAVPTLPHSLRRVPSPKSHCTFVRESQR